MSYVDVRKIRAGLGLTQSQFSERFCINICTLRDWEQGRYQPEGAARVLLSVIEQAPHAVAQVVAVTSGVAA